MVYEITLFQSKQSQQSAFRYPLFFLICLDRRLFFVCLYVSLYDNICWTNYINIYVLDKFRNQIKSLTFQRGILQFKQTDIIINFKHRGNLMYLQTMDMIKQCLVPFTSHLLIASHLIGIIIELLVSIYQMQQKQEHPVIFGLIICNAYKGEYLQYIKHVGNYFVLFCEVLVIFIRMCTLSRKIVLAHEIPFRRELPASTFFFIFLICRIKQIVFVIQFESNRTSEFHVDHGQHYWLL